MNGHLLPYLQRPEILLKSYSSYVIPVNDRSLEMKDWQGSTFCEKTDYLNLHYSQKLLQGTGH